MAWLLRILLINVLFMGYQRRRQQAAGGAPPLQLPNSAGMRAIRRRLSLLGTFAILAGRTAAVAVGATFTAVATAAGLTLWSPGPRWLSVVFLIGALVAATNTGAAVLRLRHGVAEWRDARSFATPLRVLDETDDAG